MQVENSKRQYNSIDLFKFICSILVVMIHVKPLGDAVSGSLLDYCNFGIMNYLARIAVPFYFYPYVDVYNSDVYVSYCAAYKHIYLSKISIESVDSNNITSKLLSLVTNQVMYYDEEIGAMLINENGTWKKIVTEDIQ